MYQNTNYPWWRTRKFVPECGTKPFTDHARYFILGNVSWWHSCFLFSFYLHFTFPASHTLSKKSIKLESVKKRYELWWIKYARHAGSSLEKKRLFHWIIHPISYLTSNICSHVHISFLFVKINVLNKVNAPKSKLFV